MAFALPTALSFGYVPFSPPEPHRRNKTDATNRSLRRTIEKDVFARLLVLTYHIRFAAGCLHKVKRPELCGVSFQFHLHLCPIETFMADHVLLEARLQRFE